ncbi:MAG: SMP-30/gluconolactonase/LRE family protein [Gemmatimonadales bacterium]
MVPSITLPYRVVCDGLAFPEGPLELPGGDILVTEIYGGRLTRVTPGGQKTVFATTGGGPNGAAIGPDGAIYVTQNGGIEWAGGFDPKRFAWFTGAAQSTPMEGCIQRVAPDGTVTVLYRECDGHPLKAPNDLVFDATGNFYFTDLGKTHARSRDRTGVYYASPDGKMVKEVVYPAEGPNGCALGPDGKTLFYAETPTGRVWAAAVSGPGEVGRPRCLGNVPGKLPANASSCDSMCVDGEGSVCQATIGNGGITVIPTDGRPMWHVPTGDPLTTNCCFGGPGLSTMYATLSMKGQLIAFDNWPVAGHKLHYQA